MNGSYTTLHLFIQRYIDSYPEFYRSVLTRSVRVYVITATRRYPCLRLLLLARGILHNAPIEPLRLIALYRCDATLLLQPYHPSPMTHSELDFF